MILFFLPALIIIAAVITLTVVLIRHFPQAAAIDLESLPAEQEAAMKATLMERRLKRKILEAKNKLLPVFRKISQSFSRAGKGMHQRVSHMEQRYRKKPHHMTTEQQEDVKQKVRHLLMVAKEHAEEEHWSESENKYIEVLSWDYKNVDGYFGLGEVYLAKKEYQQAKETFSYLLKLIQAQEAGEEATSFFSTPPTAPQVNEAYYDFAQCLQALDEYQNALKQLDLAVLRDPNNPKYLDRVVELCILLKDRVSAQEAFKALKSSNPDNQKLESLEEQIRNI